jgi:hypothetical protein
MSFLGLIPSIPIGRKDSDGPRRCNGPPPGASRVEGRVRLDEPKSSVAECCRSIRTNLLFMTPDTPAKSLLVTSAGPQEGKTTVAVNLAISFAQSGCRCCWSTTDMRRPRLHKAFGIPGISTACPRRWWASATCSRWCARPASPISYVLPCGACPPNPAELLHGRPLQAHRRAAHQQVRPGHLRLTAGGCGDGPRDPGAADRRHGLRGQGGPHQQGRAVAGLPAADAGRRG